MAGNANSGYSIAFKMSEAMLEKKIAEFKKEYGTGKHGIVSWPQFCAFLGYSESIVAECYRKGKEGRNAYTGRSDLLESFRTECKALTMATCNRQQQLARDECRADYFSCQDTGTADNSVRILFGSPGDDRWVQAMK
jgi:hypothetical protein